MTLPDEAATSLGSGMRDVMRTGSIGLRLPLVPTRCAEGEPALFIPDKWSVEIVRIGSETLVAPRPLPKHELSIGGRSVAGSVLHLPKGKSVVIGRDPAPKDQREQDEDQICVKMLRKGAPPERVSSAVVSLVRLSIEEHDSVYAVNGHYSKGAKRSSPQLNAFIEDAAGELVKHLNGPHVSKELSPGMELVLGYMLDGVDIPRTYRETNERILYLESLVEENPAYRLDALRTESKLGARQTCLVLSRQDAEQTELSGPQGERPALRLGRVQSNRAPMHALEFDISAVADRMNRLGSYELLVGGDLDTLRAVAEERGSHPDIALMRASRLAPVQAILSFEPGGQVRVEPLLGASVFGFVAGDPNPRRITNAEPLPDGSLLQLGATMRTKLFNRRIPARQAAAAPAKPAPRPADPMDRTRVAGGTPSPMMAPRRSWWRRLFG